MTDDAEGWELFRLANWDGAAAAFAAALEQQPGDPEALDGLGRTLWWKGDRDRAIELRRQAYAAYRAHGDLRQAGGLAVYLAAESRISGQEAAAAGWLARGRRLLSSVGDSNETGWLEIEQAKRADDPEAAAEHALAALRIGDAIDDRDIECMGLAQLGRARVRAGEVEDGIGLLDEAMTVALGGESNDPLACSDACCTTLVVCSELADLERATEWCEAVVAFAERRHYAPIQPWCQGIYGGVLIRAGRWERAEAVLVEALAATARSDRTVRRTLPLARLASLRVWQGRLEEAEELLAGLTDIPAAVSVLARLELERNRPEKARALLAGLENGSARGEGELELEAEAALAAGDLEAAERAAAGLEQVAGHRRRRDLAAAYAFILGRISAARGDFDRAVEQHGAAVGAFAELGFPLEEARARLALAHAQAESGSPLAAAAARTALEICERLGARGEADRVAALLRSLGARGRSSGRGERDELTAREREVLALVKAGLSNAEIAERLVIAPKTAEHHVSRVLGKLGVRSRAEAAAHAVREGI